MAELPLAGPRTRGRGGVTVATALTVATAFTIPLGLLALWASHGPSRVADGVPGLVAGWTLATCGFLAGRAAPWSRVGTLLVGAAIAWFAADFGSCLNVEPISHRCLQIDAVARLEPLLAGVWLALIGSAIVTYPRGRADSVGRRAVTAIVVVAALGLATAPAEAGLVVPVALVAGPLVLLAWRSDPIDPEALAAPIAGTALATGMLLDPRFAGALDGSVILAAVILLVGITAVARRRELITADRAVELGSALAHALADPTFRVDIQAPDGGGWLDTAGRPVEQPEMLEASTGIERDGQRIAVITHDPATLSDPQVRTAVVTAVELAAHNVRLRADLAGQLRELEASRRRLVDAGLREREALGTQVENDVLERMAVLRAELASALAGDADAPGIARAAAGLDAARAEIQDLARGLYPASLAAAGLAEALADLARRSPVEVTLDIATDATGGAAEDATVYFVCAEALANAARHARASVIRITVRASQGALITIVSDDGIGGADPSLGSGLRGLRDRVEAMGGTLEVRSVEGNGTRLEATIPVDLEARGPA